MQKISYVHSFISTDMAELNIWHIAYPYSLLLPNMSNYHTVDIIDPWIINMLYKAVIVADFQHI